jgi:transcriptional regulator with XRE-family HTH domain
MFSTVQTVNEARMHVRKPKPPAEAVLLKLVREAANVRTEDAAEAAGISKARWSQVESGYEVRAGRYKPVTARHGTLARMALALGISPQRLGDEGKRRDAALVLAEILRSEPPAQASAQDEEQILALIEATWGDFANAPEYVQTFAQADQFPPAFRMQAIEGYVARTRSGAQPATASGFTPETERDILRAADILRRRQAGPPRTAENGDTERAASGSEG